MADQASSIYNRYSEANGSYPLISIITMLFYLLQFILPSSDGIAHFSRTSSVRRCQHTDWDICESVRLQELQEVGQGILLIEDV